MKTWWVARQSSSDYVLCSGRLINAYYASTSFKLFVAKNLRHHVHVFYPTQWDKISTFRLKPGEGPIKVTLKLTVRSVR